MPSSSASVEEVFVGSISPIIILYHSYIHTHDIQNVHKTGMACQWYFIVLTVRIHATYKMFTKVEWLVNCILSLFLQSIHVTYEMFTDYHPVWGLFRLTPIMLSWCCLHYAKHTHHISHTIKSVPIQSHHSVGFFSNQSLIVVTRQCTC